MASANEKTKNSCRAREWMEEDNLMLIECWARDGYTFQDIANRIGVSSSTLTYWRKTYPEIHEALKKGREIIDYKVENALLKSALGYKTKEVKVTTTMKYGKVVETIKEVTNKEQAPNVYAIQCWLYNRLPDKWKKNRDNLIELDEEDTKIQVTVTRASNKQNQEDKEEDKEWQEDINKSIEIRNMTEKEIQESKKAKKEQKESVSKTQKLETKVENEGPEDDLDYWPEDWEEDVED